MPVFFPAVPFGLAAILRRLDFPGGNYQLGENSAPPAGDFRPENLTDEEWQLVQMARQEKRQASQTSSSTSSDIA